MIQSWSTVER